MLNAKYTQHNKHGNNFASHCRGGEEGMVVPCSRALCYHSHRFTTFRKCIHKRQVPTEYHQLLNLTTLLSSTTCILHISCCSSLLVLSMFNFQRCGCVFLCFKSCISCLRFCDSNLLY